MALIRWFFTSICPEWKGRQLLGGSRLKRVNLSTLSRRMLSVSKCLAEFNSDQTTFENLRACLIIPTQLFIFFSISWEDGKISANQHTHTSTRTHTHTYKHILLIDLQLPEIIATIMMLMTVSDRIMIKLGQEIIFHRDSTDGFFF